MEITVNGEKYDVRRGISLFEYISESGYDMARTAVELNKNIVSKSGYKNCILSEYDMLEVVTFVGGG
ncbi:sulfur carrier protein ThiS [Johnsonella ignava]|jgi:thiamine biosynthesis protein ThiS|uniref:sulfur carrier protein ThiS n=1 Tax=Johnsonella ignava TaxID=43995 RepID=UPI0023F4BDEB|nr:sulfur carrier protein ThiS [Johnsonella ignava]